MIVHCFPACHCEYTIAVKSLFHDKAVYNVAWRVLSSSGNRRCSYRRVGEAVSPLYSREHHILASGDGDRVRDCNIDAFLLSTNDAGLSLRPLFNRGL